jgi:uncharacterized protein (TIGR00255 family)
MTHLYSMTGYGKASGAGKRGEEVLVEIRSFNSKTLKLNIRLPGPFVPFEDEVRARIRKTLRRGSGGVTVRFTSPSDLPEVRVNTPLLEKYAVELKAMGEYLEMDTCIDLAVLANLPGAVELAEPHREASREEIDVMLGVLDEALDRHAEARRLEGKTLEADLKDRAGLLLELIAKIRDLAPRVVEDYRERLAQRVQDLLGDGTGLDAEALRPEIVLFAERSDIHEECVRAESHLQNFLRLLDQGGELGRRLDFIAQEIHREVNTITSKANDYEIAELAVQAKAEVDKIKEQVQNVE